MHANCASPPCGTTRTSPPGGPSAARGRAVRRRRPPGRGRPPARRLRSGGQRLACPLQGRRAAGAAEPRAERSGAQAVRQPTRPGRTGLAGGRHHPRVRRGAVDPGPGRHGDRAPHRVRHHPAWVWALLRHRLGWTVQRPERRAAERDQAAIDRWVKEDWPRILQTPNGAEPAWSSSTSQRSA